MIFSRSLADQAQSNQYKQAFCGPMSSPVQVDDQTPLLPSQSVRKTKFPWAQFSIVLCLQVVDPLHSHVVHPFLPQVRLLFWSTLNLNLVNSSFEISELLMEKRVRLDITLEPWYVSNLSSGSFTDRHVAICLLPQSSFEYTVFEHSLR